MSDTYEEQVTEYESERNEAMQRWFDARPNVPRTRNTERVWEGGFRMAWDRHDPSHSDMDSAPKDARRVVFELPPMRVSAFWCSEFERWVTTRNISIDYINPPARVVSVIAEDNG